MKDSLLSGSSALAGNGFHAIHGIQFKRKFLELSGSGELENTFITVDIPRAAMVVTGKTARMI
jgi:hypothetical protein